MIIALDSAALPDDARREIERVFAQIADAVATIPPASPFFASLDESVLQIDVAGHRVGYRVNPRRREVRVIEASPLRRQ